MIVIYYPKINSIVTLDIYYLDYILAPIDGTLWMVP